MHRLAAILLLFPVVAYSADWPQWRGPSADGVSKEAGWLTTFPEKGPKTLWTAKLGRGHSSIVLSKGRLFTLANDTSTNAESICCLDADTGKEVWKFAYKLESVQRGSNPTGGTPTVAGEHVFVCGAGLNLHCLDAATGKVVWQRDLMKELPGQATSYGYQLSPVIVGDLVVLPALTRRGGGGGKNPEPRAGAYPPTGGVLLGLDRKTGKEVWRNTDGASPWSTPVLATIEDKPTLVHLTGKFVLGLDPSNGKTRWSWDPASAGFKVQDVAAAPLIAGNLIVTPVHDGPGARPPAGMSTVCLKIADGKPTLVWKTAEWCHWFHSGAIWDGHVYGYDERSAFYCFALATGELKWRSRDLGATGANGGGFMIADGKVLAIDARQNLIVAEVSPTGPKVLAKASIFGSESGYQCETAPVLLDGRLYCRNHTQLICLDLRKP